MQNDIIPVCKVFLAHPGGHGKPFFGPGMVCLLDNIQITGNVREACKKMDISYSKGWKLLNILEACLDYPILNRRQGGKSGGDTKLTAEGELLLKNHHAFEKACAESVEKLFKQYYGE